MAKKGSREYITLECDTCKNRNYRTQKQTRAKGSKNQAEKLILKKFCSTCRKHTEHKERKK